MIRVDERVSTCNSAASNRGERLVTFFSAELSTTSTSDIARCAHDETLSTFAFVFELRDDGSELSEQEDCE